jgi:hypothetical protein
MSEETLSRVTWELYDNGVWREQQQVFAHSMPRWRELLGVLGTSIRVAKSMGTVRNDRLFDGTVTWRQIDPEPE